METKIYGGIGNHARLETLRGWAASAMRKIKR